MSKEKTYEIPIGCEPLFDPNEVQQVRLGRASLTKNCGIALQAPWSVPCPHATDIELYEDEVAGVNKRWKIPWTVGAGSAIVCLHCILDYFAELTIDNAPDLAKPAKARAELVRLDHIRVGQAAQIRVLRSAIETLRAGKPSLP